MNLFTIQRCFTSCHQFNITFLYQILIANLFHSAIVTKQLKINLNMSQFSDSSENFHTIIANMLSFKKQWSQVPEVVYLIIKAIHNHAEQLQENIYRQRQIITEHSVKMKEIQYELAALSPNFKKQPSFLGASNGHSSRFHKEKKKNLFSSEFEPQNRSKRSQVSPDSRKQNSFEKGLDKTMVEQVKALAEAIIDKNSKKINLEFQKLKDELNIHVIEISQRVVKQKQQCEESRLGLEAKISEMEDRNNRKIQQQRSNVMRFAEESAMEVEKILIQINNINLRLSQIEQKRIIYPENKIMKTKPNSNVEPDFTQQGKLCDKIANLSKDFSEFKIKVMKEMTQFIKMEGLETIVHKLQQESADKISKVSQDVENLAKLIDNHSKVGLNKNQSKILIPQVDQQSMKKKDKSSHQSLAQIQESLQKIEGHFKEKLKAAKKQLLAEMSTRIEREQLETKKQIRQQIEEREKTLCDVVQRNYDRLKIEERESFSIDWSWKNGLQNLSNQMVLCRYLHLGERNSKDFIQWDRQACNLMEENYAWKQSSHVVVVMAAGLYRVQAGLYADEEADQIEAFLVLNGTPLCQLKNKEAPINCKAPARGSLFNEALLLPGKSKIWIKTQLPFFGQAYLQILKL